MRPFLVSVLTLALVASTSAQSSFSGRNDAPQSGGSQLPPITVAKPGARSAPAANTRFPGDLAQRVPDAQAPRAVPVRPPAAGAGPGSGRGATFRPGDSFELRLTGMPYDDAAPYSLTFTIGGDGFINIPLGGQVRAAGLTQTQLEMAIQQRLVSEKIFRWPTATINVPNQARFITVGGAVRNPHRMGWSADLTLTSAINAAGGGGDFASDRVNLIRGGSVTQYRLKQLKRNPSEDPPLLPGDQVELL